MDRPVLSRLAAPLLNSVPEALEFADGRIGVAGHPEQSVAFREAAQKMPGEAFVCLADRKRQFESFRDDLAATQSGLTARLLAADKPGEAVLEDWSHSHGEALQRTHEFLAAIDASGELSVSKLMLIASQIQALA